MLAAVLALASSCSRESGVPAVPSEQYESLCSAFYLGLAALQSGEDVNARKGLVAATDIAPGEPAAWLNLGLLQFRQQDFEGAYQSVSRALKLAAEDSRVEALLGVIESRRGKQTEAIGHLTRAVSLNGRNLKAAFALAQETERQNSAVAEAAAQKLLEQILTVQPNNVAVLLENIRLAAKRGDEARVKAAVGKLADGAGAWPDAARQQLASLQSATGGNVRGAAIQAQFLKNVLVRAPAYRQSLDEVRTPATSAGEPFLKFFKLPSPLSTPDEADKGLRFERAGVPLGENVLSLQAVSLDSQSAATPLWVDGKGTHVGERTTIPFPPDGAGVGPHGVATADFNYDFKTDIAVACSKGLRFFEQGDGGAFHDVTAAAKLPTGVLNASYSGAWAFDYDLDGDLDLLLSTGEALRNNGDGTFAVAHPFGEVNRIVGFASADVDGDGDADVAVIDGRGNLVVFANERLGDYRRRSVPGNFGNGLQALAAADVNGDGLSDFVLLTKSGDVLRLSDAGAGKSWTTAQLAQANGADSLLLADLDNNGALDLIAGNQVFLGDGKTFSVFAGGQTGSIADAADLDGDGRLELLSAAGTWHSRGTKNYHWQTVRPLAARTNGDQRMNSFGVGGEIEVRADLLTQKQIIHGPNMHFGMGSHHRGTEFARIAWPNGLIQTEFNLKPDQTLVAEQRLKGSCPYLFTWDGTAMRFAKDVAPMSAALGAHDGSGAIAKAGPTREWFSLSGDQLHVRDGRLRLSVTDEYWESYFVNQYELTAADHPRGSQMFVDERVATPPVPRRIYLTGPSHDFATVRKQAFAKDTYSGVGRDHFVELTLPADAPGDREIYLIAQGSLKPWDDMTLVSLSQGGHARPQDLSLETRDEHGDWKTVKSGLGVPAGRLKTAVISLKGVPVNRALRLRTNLAIYWDRLSWAEAWRGPEATTTQLPLAKATLRHRGFSAVDRDVATGIERPDYRRVVETGDRWPSLEGYYTRFGDVRPLIEESDERFAIMSSGDELQLEFREAPALTTGMVRDYVFAGDGWIKEGDPSFRGSQALLPLPYRGMREYRGQAAGLESQRAYRAHPEDWQMFHTRYLTGETLRSGLWQ